MNFEWILNKRRCGFPWVGLGSGSLNVSFENGFTRKFILIIKLHLFFETDNELPKSYVHQLFHKNDIVLLLHVCVWNSIVPFD